MTIMSNHRRRTFAANFHERLDELEGVVRPTLVYVCYAEENVLFQTKHPEVEMMYEVGVRPRDKSDRDIARLAADAMQEWFNNLPEQKLEEIRARWLTAGKPIWFPIQEDCCRR